MALKTPVRIRGKRTATTPEKWHPQKRRKVDDDHSPHSGARISDSVATASSDTASTPRKRKRHEPELSRLEQLPTEVIQTIFEYAANIDLAMVSPHLTSQLSSTHMYHRMFTRLFLPVCGFFTSRGQPRTGTRDELQTAARLMECKFVTWSFVCSWLDKAYRRYVLNLSIRDGNKPECWQVWSRLGPRKLPPPQKLLRASWSDDNRKFLKLFTDDHDCQMLLEDHPVLIEAGLVGLANAIKEEAADVVSRLVHLGICPDTEMLRNAIINEGCNESIVRLLLHAVSVSSSLHPDGVSAVDVFDSAIWAWAERAKADGNPKGDRLLDMLKAAIAGHMVHLPRARTLSAEQQAYRNVNAFERRRRQIH